MFSDKIKQFFTRRSTIALDLSFEDKRALLRFGIQMTRSLNRNYGPLLTSELLSFYVKDFKKDKRLALTSLGVARAICLIIGDADDKK